MPLSDATIATVLEIARRAGEEILAVYRQSIDVTTKADASPLTIADLRSHVTIVQGLTQLVPSRPILSEESSEVSFATRASWRSFWLVDPLDGTKEFLKRNDEFTVNIALIDDTQVSFGVVYVPASDTMYWGGKNVGAFRQVGTDNIDRISVAARSQSPLRIVGSRSHASDELSAVLPRVGPHELVQIGSSLKLCAIAEGSADVYPRFGPTSEWDIAAAQAVVEGAGGRVVDRDGQPLRYNTKESVLNPYFVAYGDVTKDWARILFQG